MRISLQIISSLLLLTIGFSVRGQTPLKMRDTTIKGPQTFAIIMGISKYKYVRPLAYADKDAELFRDYLKSPGGGSIKDENLFCLLNEKASNSNFWGKGFQWLKAKNLQKGDRLFIYLAGHGDAIDEDQFFFLGYDCNPAGDKNNYLISGAIQLYNLKKKIADETDKGVEVVFIMDACRSNELPGGTKGQSFLNSAISEKKAGEIIMLATGAGQESLEDASIGNGHGLFTYYLVDGLSGSADSVGAKDNKVSYDEIKNYVDRNVPTTALQKFKRSQDPYFCCNEYSNKVISIVDTAYLSKWLKLKKQQTKGPGNSFYGEPNSVQFASIDTALVEIYNLFNKAVFEKHLTGNSSAEYYYEQLNKKYSGSPYTSDARSTLAVEFIDLAQNDINQYLECQDDVSPTRKQELYESGNHLEKAIKLVMEDDADFANSLLGRMYLLKSSGDFGKNGKNGDIAIAFKNAFAAYAIDPGAAYINNRLATLHLANNNKDSAVYYARRATQIAPDWLCASNTLAKASNTSTQPAKNSVDSIKQSKKKRLNKPEFGIIAGSGISQLKPNTTISRNDTLTGIQAVNIVILDLGFFSQVSVSKMISWRPSVNISLEGGELIYEKKSASTGTVSSESLQVKTAATIVSSPFVFRFSDKSIAPYLSFGPSFSYIVSQNAASSSKLPLKKTDVIGNIGLGEDIAIPRTKLILSAELKFSKGFLDMNDDINNFYTHSISNLKKQVFAFNVYLRWK